jgi:S1-C subfamily serine protease/HEAT repeat protein
MLVAAICGGVAVLLVSGFVAVRWVLPRRTPNPAAAEMAAMAQPAPPPKPPLEPIQPVAPGDAAGPTGALPLEALKAAVVYVKVDVGSRNGSGFVVHAKGGVALVVTNYPVVGGPEMPDGRKWPGPVRITAVFRSGTPQEQAVEASLIARDAKTDLAVIRAGGVRDMPRPIDCRRTPHLSETMPVLVPGFPFGANLDRARANPAISVSRGSVSSLRQDRQGVLEQVQLDADLSPGISGGPVVDESGALVGVAVARVRPGHVGFAVPVARLNRLLEGYIEPPESIATVMREGGKWALEATVPVADPLDRLRSAVLRCGPADEISMPARRGDGWDPLTGGKTVALMIIGPETRAVLPLPPPGKGETRILTQVSYVDGSGRTVHGEPREMLATAPRSAVPPVVVRPAPPVNPPDPPGPPMGERLTRLLGDLKSTDAAKRRATVEKLARVPPRGRLKEVSAAVRPLLNDADPATRAAAGTVLAASDPKEAAPDLVRLLEDPAPRAHYTVFRALRDLKDPRVAEAMAARLMTNEDMALAALVLKAIGPPAEKAVLPYLTSPNVSIRATAFQIIRDIGGAASLAALEAIARDNEREADNARGLMPRLRDRVPLAADEWPQALDDLKALDRDRRTRAARRIAATPPTDDRRADVVARLEPLLNDVWWEAETAAVKALTRWGGKNAVPLLAGRLDATGGSLDAREEAIGALAELRDASAAAALVKHLRSGPNSSEGRALTAMGSIAEKSVLTLLTNSFVEVRAEGCRILAEVGGPDSLAALEQASKDKSTYVAAAAQDALAILKARLEVSDPK